jgi:hypothetical protein
MELSPRHFPVATARNEIDTAVTNAVEKHSLTYGELFSILAGLMASWARYAVKDERGEK